MQDAEIDSNSSISVYGSKVARENTEKPSISDYEPNRNLGFKGRDTPIFDANSAFETANQLSGGEIHPESSVSSLDAKQEFNSENDVGSRLVSRSSLRLKYEAEVSSLKKRIGSLESMRQELGLSQRKMCQLLMVDPSAWTRWTREGADAPPHIYRMLQWYLAIQEKYPALDIQFWLSNLARTPTDRGWEKAVATLSKSVEDLRKERERATLTIRSLEIRLRNSELEQKEARDSLNLIETAVSESHQAPADLDQQRIIAEQLKLDQKQSEVELVKVQYLKQLENHKRKFMIMAITALLFGALASYLFLKHSF